MIENEPAVEFPMAVSEYESATDANFGGNDREIIISDEQIGDLSSDIFSKVLGDCSKLKQNT